MTDAAVSRLKTELKRSLRQRVGEAVDDVCDAFVEDLGLPTTLPQVGASGNENDYECCRRFVEYIVRNMDTSSKFAEQMDCIILAYQSNAPVDVLNSVVTQNLWMRRTGPESGAEKTGLTDGREKVTAMKRSNTVIQVQSTGGNDAPKKSVVGTAANLSAALVENKEINAAQAKSAAISPRNSKSEHANNNKRRQNGFLVADMLKGTPLVVAKTSKSAASKRKTSPLQNLHPRLSPRNPFAGLDEVSSAVVVASRSAPVRVNTLQSGATSGKANAPGSSLPAKKAKLRSQINHERTNASKSNESVSTTGLRNVQTNPGAAVTSRPREWGKRKRLVTSKRPKAVAATSKRARRAVSTHFESSDLSSTETDNSEDEKAKDDKETHSGLNYFEGQRIGSKLSSASARSTIAKTRKLDVVVAVSNADLRTMTIAAQEARTMAVQKNLNGEEAPATTKIESKIAKAGKQAAKAKVAKQVPSTNDHTECVIEGGGENKKVKTESADAQVGIETLRMEDEQSEALVDAALCQVERDLAAGDKTGDLDAAKRSFQAMLNAVVGHHAMDSHSMVLNDSNSNEKARAVADPISNLCDAAQRSPDQTCIFKMRLRDTILIVDALLCKPPRGQSCSRDCKAIRAQMCNEFTPCINPTCRAWHEAETHSELCPDNQCEFKTRVVLRETMHLIEHKLQEVTEARNALELANTALLSPPRRSSKVTLSVGNAKVFNRIETLQNELQLLNAELAVLIDTRKQHWTTLNSIGIDSNADKVDEFPDFSSHYTCRIRRSKKARSSQQQLRR
ncbi:hypothetical protein PRIC2_008762 [Phytophthora ramorum]